MIRADRIRAIYEQISDDYLNGKTYRPTMKERAEAAEARVTELEAALRHISELRDPGTAEVAKLFWHAKDHARAALAAPTKEDTDE